jgi:hypothetical protein
MSVPTYDENRINAVSPTCAKCHKQYHVPLRNGTRPPEPYTCIQCRRLAVDSDAASR